MSRISSGKTNWVWHFDGHKASAGLVNCSKNIKVSIHSPISKLYLQFVWILLIVLNGTVKEWHEYVRNDIVAYPYVIRKTTITCHAHCWLCWTNEYGGGVTSYQYRDPMIMIRRSHDRVIFIMLIPYLERRFYIESGPLSERSKLRIQLLRHFTVQTFNVTSILCFLKLIQHIKG